MELPGTRGTWFEGFAKHDFEIAGRPVTVVCPERPRPGHRWVWEGEFLDAFPTADLALLRAGFYLVYVSYPDQFGCPATVGPVWDAACARLTGDFGFAPKMALMGLSRGGLYCYQWAAANPEKVACIYGDAPVCDIASWPAGKGKGNGSPENWAALLEVYGFADEADALACPTNPIDNLAPLAAADIPILHVYGDADNAVPWDENTGILAERYRALGGAIELICKPGCAHHPHGLQDPTAIVDFIITHNSGE